LVAVLVNTLINQVLSIVTVVSGERGKALASC